MPRNSYKNQVLDTRPDRLDLRDRIYLPHLRSLPAQYPQNRDIDEFLECYINSELILDQGQEGACTGFGLAAVINYLIWRYALSYDVNTGEIICPTNAKDLRVSERMLYHMARVYDEWDGEDYSGSSCRGAMKGWHRHGVCLKNLWEYDPNGIFIKPNNGWAENAIKQPLGAYYRINKDSVVDMQAAIVEVGAIYCSAMVHDGWWLKKTKSLPIIDFHENSVGGHAFAIVGYTNKGFIIQNSWGTGWGFQGFAILTYSDWVKHGSDAWVASRGVPLETGSSPSTFSNHPLQSVSADLTERVSSSIRKALKYEYENEKIAPWSEEKAYQHSLVISNNGRPKLSILSAEDAEASARIICYDNIKKWLDENKRYRKIAIYAHGGLNSEEASISRIRVMAPYFKENGIYPLFVTWKTGLWETLINILKQRIDNIFNEAGLDPASSKAEGIFDVMRDAVDRSIESFARDIKAKGIWTEMKDNAKYANDRAIPGFPQRGLAARPGGMVILAQALEDLKNDYNDIETHIIGHSAGSILLGYWLKELEKRKLQVSSTTLYAPACTVAFANQFYKKAVDKKVIDKQSMYIHMMDDDREMADDVGKIYGKSLLYLVSRALEDLHKMPLLGMEAAWDKSNFEKDDGKFHDTQLSEMKNWSKFISSGKRPILYRQSYGRAQTNLKGDTTDLAHGSFDNDIRVIEGTLKKIKGTSKLANPVENLTGF